MASEKLLLGHEFVPWPWRDEDVCSRSLNPLRPGATCGQPRAAHHTPCSVCGRLTSGCCTVKVDAPPATVDRVRCECEYMSADGGTCPMHDAPATAGSGETEHEALLHAELAMDLALVAFDPEAMKWSLARVRAALIAARHPHSSGLPCCRCGREVVEFSVPNDVWNRVVRKGGPETDREYLCAMCFGDDVRTALDAAKQALPAPVEELHEFVPYIVCGECGVGSEFHPAPCGTFHPGRDCSGKPVDESGLHPGDACERAGWWPRVAPTISSQSERHRLADELIADLRAALDAREAEVRRLEADSATAYQRGLDDAREEAARVCEAQREQFLTNGETRGFNGQRCVELLDASAAAIRALKGKPLEEKP